MTERPVISARPSKNIKVIECYQETRCGIEKKTERFSSALIKFLFDLPLLEHHNIRPFGVNALNGESIIRYLFPSSFVVITEWKKSNETRDGY